MYRHCTLCQLSDAISSGIAKQAPIHVESIFFSFIISFSFFSLFVISLSGFLKHIDLYFMHPDSHEYCFLFPYSHVRQPICLSHPKLHGHCSTFERTISIERSSVQFYCEILRNRYCLLVSFSCSSCALDLVLHL